MKLLSVRTAMEETGLTRSQVQTLMRRCTKFTPDGVRMVLVSRDEFMTLLYSRTTR